ncbi:MAG: tetratricopeptide repeat protein [Candidatus Omnitrophica bacterium]|nr:tetratricopeptide repeat protein [Candidatus Omnitrophota bacterium]
MLKLIAVIVVLIFSSIATTAVYNKTQQADINYYRGKAYLERGEFRKATPYFEKVLAVDPFRKEAIGNLAYSYQWSNRHKEAIVYFRDAIQRYPQNYKIKKAFADTLSWQGYYKEAIEVYLEVMRQGEDIDTIKSLARVYAWDKQFDKSREALRGILSRYPEDIELNLLYAETLFFSGDYHAAEGIIQDILRKDPGNIKARVYLGDLFAYHNYYPEAIDIYREIIALNKDRSVKEKLAAVLSWDKQYKDSLALYDELLLEKEDPLIRRQKARVLGWARRYKESLAEYRLILARGYDPLIALEMEAKDAYWNGRIKKAIDYYSRLIEKDHRNGEAIFDLSQIYSYQSMWSEAAVKYNQLLYFYPNHFRGKEGLEKVGLNRGHILGTFGYEYLEQASASRDMDVKKHSVFGGFNYPLDEHFNFKVQYKFSTRSFTDFSRIVENEGRFDLTYLNNPDWRAGAYYDFIGYNRGINPMHTFGLNAGLTALDFLNVSFFFDRKRLENNSTVIRNRLFSDNFKGRLDFDFNYRLKGGAEYTFMKYSDGNYNNLPAIDLVYLISLDPRRLSVKYRYFYQNYHIKKADYFSPKGFSTNVLALNWRHFLNKEEIFFGTNDLYYDLGYQASVDSQDIVCHTFSAGLYWDISKRFNLNITVSQTESSASVYKDKNIFVSMKYYF